MALDQETGDDGLRAGGGITGNAHDAEGGAGWGDPETGESIVVSPNDTRKLMDSLKVKHPETLIKSLGKRFALKEPHNSFVKIMTSLQRRGIPFERK